MTGNQKQVADVQCRNAVLKASAKHAARRLQVSLSCCSQSLLYKVQKYLLYEMHAKHQMKEFFEARHT